MPLARSLAATALLLWALPLAAQEGPFGAGWRLEPEASTLQFSSIKNQAIIETSSFASLAGEIAPDGTARLTVLLDSVDTEADLRNVRMRFLFFETFLHPEATVTARIDPAQLADLAERRRKTIALPFTLDLHGVTRQESASLSLTLIEEDLIAVSSAAPVMLKVEDYGLAEGLKKLEEAASVSIVPSTTVSFDLLFRANGTGAPTPPQEETAPASAALETAGAFSTEACLGRFEILSRSGNIHFHSGSARLSADSAPLLQEVVDIITRCPALRVEVAGHTDSVGSRQANQRLSERRAAAVVQFLSERGIAGTRLRAIGFGEDRPLADNGSEEGRRSNRRIEFAAAD